MNPTIWWIVPILLATAVPLLPVAADAPTDSPNPNPNPYAVRGTDGVPTDKPRLLRPDTKVNAKGEVVPDPKVIWRGVVTRSRLDLFASPDAQEPLEVPGPDRPKLGDLVWVMKYAPATRNGLLVGRFLLDAQNALTFDRFLGWCHEEDLLDSGTGLTAERAREDLKRLIAPNDPRWANITRWLPTANNPNFRNVPLKAVPDPDLGRRAFPDPVPNAGLAKALDDAEKSGTGRPLAGFGFYFISKVVVRDKDNIHCLLSHRPTLPISETVPPEVYRESLLGWVELKHLFCWTTREAYEVDFAADAIDRRTRAGVPFRLFAEAPELADWVTARYAKGPTPTDRVPLYQETPDDGWVKAYPWDPRWMRLPVLERFGVPGTQVKGARLGMIASRGGTLIKTQEEFEKNVEKVREAIKNSHVLQVTVVLDGTGSMRAVIDATKAGVVKFVERLKRDENAQPELTKLEIRVSVVVYRDHPDKFPCPPYKTAPPLVEDSGKVFLIKDDSQVKEFAQYVGGITCYGNTDAPEEPLEGIARACERFLRPGPDSLALRGASSLILLAGNSGNNVKEGARNPNTRLTMDKVAELLCPKTLADGNRVDRGARVPVFPLFCPEEKMFEDEDYPLWKSQMLPLAELSGGKADTVRFYEAGADPGEQMYRLVAASVARTRAQLVAQVDALRSRGLWLAAAAGKNAADAPVNDQLALERLREVCQDADQFDRVVKAMAATFLIQVYGIDRLPEDGAAPRLRLCVLLSIDEIDRLAIACEDIATNYEDLIAPGGNGKPLPADAFVRLLGEAFAATAGKGAAERARGAIEAGDLRKVQEEISTLPVVFGCLCDKPPAGVDAARGLIVKLRERAKALKDISKRQPNRHFSYGPEMTYAWVYERELP